MSKTQLKRVDCQDQTEAVEAADALITRLQDVVAQQMPPDSNVAPEDAYHEIVEALETAPEIEAVREAAGRDPQRFGSGAAADACAPARDRSANRRGGYDRRPTGSGSGQGRCR